MIEQSERRTNKVPGSLFEWTLSLNKLLKFSDIEKLNKKISSDVRVTSGPNQLVVLPAVLSFSFFLPTCTSRRGCRKNEKILISMFETESTHSLQLSLLLPILLILVYTRCIFTSVSIILLLMSCECKVHIQHFWTNLRKQLMLVVCAIQRVACHLHNIYLVNRHNLAGGWGCGCWGLDIILTSAENRRSMNLQWWDCTWLLVLWSPNMKTNHSVDNGLTLITWISRKQNESVQDKWQHVMWDVHRG